MIEAMLLAGSLIVANLPAIAEEVQKYAEKYGPLLITLSEVV